jgi:copper chaperone CopZ
VVIKKALEGLEGVGKANISYSKKKGEVFFDPDNVTEQEIVNKVTQIGFKAKVSKKQLKVRVKHAGRAYGVHEKILFNGEGIEKS